MKFKCRSGFERQKCSFVHRWINQEAETELVLTSSSTRCCNLGKVTISHFNYSFFFHSSIKRKKNMTSLLLFGNLREKCGTIAKQYCNVCITHTNLMSAHILTKFTTNLYPHTRFSSGDDLSIGNSSLLPTQPAIVIIIIGKTLYISTNKITSSS